MNYYPALLLLLACTIRSEAGELSVERSSQSTAPLFEGLAALRYVIARNPDHPGANHFFIHAVEAGPYPEQGIPSADRLLRFAPRAGHLVHMPSHIFMRVGQYEDAELANALAVKADRAYIQHCAAQGFYPGA